jgi:hypothetical protein
MDHQNDDMDTHAESSAAPTQRTIPITLNTASSPNADRSRRIYEKIFAEAITEASSANDPVAAPAANERNSFLTSSATSSTLNSPTLNSAVIEESDWRRRNQQPLSTTTPAKLRSLGDTSVEDGEAASSLNSAPIEEEDWRRRNQQRLNNSAAVSFPSHSETAVEDDEASASKQQDRGGRLWRLAGEVAAKKASLLGKNRSGPVGHLAETFLERMRSRADPNALVSPPTPPRHDRK